jgi:hypothetical protein
MLLYAAGRFFIEVSGFTNVIIFGQYDGFAGDQHHSGAAIVGFACCREYEAC